MAKQSRFKKDYRANASKLHKCVGDMLRSSAIFRNYKIYQEYPVNRVSPYYDSGREHFDWCILDLMVVIEVHGQQHYEMVQFGGITTEEALDNFRKQRERDQAKQKAAEEAGWTYVVFKYDEDITIHNLLDKINSFQPSTAVREDVDKLGNAQKKHNDPKHQDKLARAREYRKKQYQRQKEWRKKHGNHRR